MSATPTRVDWEATAAEVVSPLQEGNLVLESIARQQAMSALLAFSGLRGEIRNGRFPAAGASNRDLFATERFLLDEVLQLICDRAQAITQADGLMVALAEAPEGRSAAAPSAFVCRASAGPLAVDRGTPLIRESEFLQDCLDSGSILRCDDCAVDARVEMDFARAIGVRSTVLIPLGGRRSPLGVLQAFSNQARGFTDQHIRIFDLFAELVLSALKPEEQDRRINWLADVAGDVLKVKPQPAPNVVAAALVAVETEVLHREIPTVAAGLAPSPASATFSITPTTTAPAVTELPVAQPPAPPQSPTISAASTGLPELRFPAQPLAKIEDDAYYIAQDLTPGPDLPRALPHPARLPLPGSSRPGLSVVIGLVAVAALFSAGAWWGMATHGKTASATIETAKIAAGKLETAKIDASKLAASYMGARNSDASPLGVTAPPPPDVLAVSDNLMSPQKVASDSAPLTPVDVSKLAALPKVTGLRHWSSSMGSTVVIDMEDNVPYEVHRLMSPERIYFDLHDTVLSPDLDGKTMDVGDASLTRVRIAQPVAGVTRIVLDTKDGSNFSVSMESSPYRLVVELRGSQKTLLANQFPSSRAPSTQLSAALALAAPKTAPIAPLDAKASTAKNNQPLPAKTGKFRIVLDAGHGGWDLGTVGRQGLLEKDLVLDVTQRLGKLLQSRLGSEVMLTRSDDNYLPLDQRADFANHAQADLFVSVHANYSSSAAARGVETYYTNLFSAPGSKEVEKHDDGAFAKLTPVSLSTGGLHEKIEESRRLAASVQRSLYAALAASSPDIRNRGTKDASFAVLTGTTMPAILTEISFVSSPEDEHKLQSAAYRQQIAEALYKGIASYEQSAPKAKIAQLQKPSAR